MLHLTESSPKIIIAPMAGGVFTVDLVAAAYRSGALGFLAAGYKTPEQMMREILLTEKATEGHFGVNLFCPEGTPLTAAERKELERFREALLPVARRFDVTLPEIDALPQDQSDFFAEKIRRILHHPPPIVSFTFGLPGSDVVSALKQQDTLVVATVTTPEEAKAALALGVGALAVQGIEAGGHRGTFLPGAHRKDWPLTELIAAIKKITPLPLIAAGGLNSKERLQEVLNLGVTAGAFGTYFLGAKEAGTNPTHRRALQDFKIRKTMLTPAFTGKLARGIENTFSREFSSLAPHLYPWVHYLTQPIRQYAGKNNEPEFLHLWAGVNFAETREDTVTNLLAGLA